MRFNSDVFAITICRFVMTGIAYLFAITVFMFFYVAPSVSTFFLALIGVLALWLRYDNRD
jgi:hypothetical protein